MSDSKYGKPKGGFARALTVRFAFPFVLAAAKLFKLDFDKTAAKLIDINNRLTLRSVNKYKLSRIMVLIPHCLQHNECELKITGDISKCSRCGRCDIEKLASLGKEYNLDINIASGGSSALRLVREANPQLIAAVACERDLVSGIMDIYPMPVIAISNTRPEGPCRNTRVDGDKIKDALQSVKH